MKGVQFSESDRRELAEDVLARFLRYVQIWTTSDPNSSTIPSTTRQLDLIRMLESECKALALRDVVIDQSAFLYARLPGTVAAAQPFGLLAHVDTSPDQPGEGVKPVVHENWSGAAIRYPDDPELVLDIASSPELANFIGDSIITASGTTLLGADDKAGVAAIMAAVTYLVHHPEIPRPDLTICFTHDEEIGRGVDGIDLNRLPKFCYTIDGGFPGELEDECFDAYRVSILFVGHGVHPGYAKGKMLNAGSIAARFVAAVSERETPEATEGREGFFHLSKITGDHERAQLDLILRDFEPEQNARRLQYLEHLRSLFLLRYPRLGIEIETQHQYQNMRRFLEPYPFVVERAKEAILRVGIPVVRRPIRGGTDGSRLSERGHPTPNLFAGGMLFHSRKEWVAHRALTQASETILQLAHVWASAPE